MRKAKLPKYVRFYLETRQPIKDLAAAISEKHKREMKELADMFAQYRKEHP